MNGVQLGFMSLPSF